jgi:hypothetical protein
MRLTICRELRNRLKTDAKWDQIGRRMYHWNLSAAGACCCFKIVVDAQDGWICGDDPCDVEPSFLHFDAHDLDCVPTMLQFYPSQSAA